MQKTKNHSIYINITETSVALFLIADVLNISKYIIFLLYETFIDDVFLFFTACCKAGYFENLTDFRLNRCFQHAKVITPVLLGATSETLGVTEMRSYQIVNPYLYEKKLRIKEDQEAYNEPK